MLAFWKFCVRTYRQFIAKKIYGNESVPRKQTIGHTKFITKFPVQFAIPETTFLENFLLTTVTISFISNRVVIVTLNWGTVKEKNVFEFQKSRTCSRNFNSS